MKNKLTLLLFSILLISSISAVPFVITYNGNSVDYTVIEKEYRIILNSDLTLTSNYQDTLISLGSNQWKWIPNSKAGIRTFTIGEESFTFNVLSEVDEFLNKITNFKIFVGEDNSYIETEFNPQGIEIEYEGTKTSLSPILDSINFNITFQEGEIYPQVNSLFVSSFVAIAIDQLYEDGDIPFNATELNENPEYWINDFIDRNGQTIFPITSNIYKIGNNYGISAEEGYSSISGDLENQVQDFIESKLEYFTPLDIVDSIFRFTDYDLSEYVDLDYDYQVAIDFNNLVLEDGIYLLTFLYEDSHGNTGTKNFNVILDITEPPEPEPDCSNGETTCEGTNYYICENEEWVNQGQLDGFCGYNFVCSSGQTNCDGDYYFICVNNNWINYGQTDGYCGYESEDPVNETDETEIYIPSDPIILEYVNKVEGLKNGTVIQIEVKQTMSSPVLSNSNKLGYLNITTNQNTTASLYFHILKSKVTDKNKVSLYILEDSWVKLTTTYLDENSLYYEYKAEVPHFSIFMIAEDTYVAPRKKGSGGSSCNYNQNYDWECSEWSICLNGLQTRTCKEYNNCHSFYGKPEELKSCVVEKPDDVIIIDDEPKPKSNIKNYIIFGIIGLLIILVILIINLILKERKKEKVVK